MVLQSPSFSSSLSSEHSAPSAIFTMNDSQSHSHHAGSIRHGYDNHEDNNMTCAESIPCHGSTSTVSSDASPKSVVEMSATFATSCRIGGGGSISILDSPLSSQSFTRTCVEPELRRIKELEQKRLALRHQRFSLEQKLYEFCGRSRESGGNGPSILMSPETPVMGKGQVTGAPSRTSNNRDTGCKHVLDFPWKEESSGVRVIYSGPVNERGQPHGSDGILKFSDGQVYRGDICNGIRYGTF